jgi:hypothetical protein
VDTPDGLDQLVAVRAALASMDLPGLVEVSRRGGHLWLFLAEPLPAAGARAGVLAVLQEIKVRWDVVLPDPLELYPSAANTVAGTLGQAVRLPLGVHQLTSRRYPLLDGEGLPHLFTSLERAVRFLVERPAIPATVLAAWTARARPAHEPDRVGEAAGPSVAQGSTSVGRVGTCSPVIRWVDAHVSVLDLLDELAPECASASGTRLPRLVSVPRRSRARRAGPAGHAFLLCGAGPALWLELALPLQQLPARARPHAPMPSACSRSCWTCSGRRESWLRARAGPPPLRSRTPPPVRLVTPSPARRKEQTLMPLKIPPIQEAAGILDEVQAWFLAQAERDGWVYTSVLRQLVNRLYRDRDYQEKRKVQGRRTAYDYAVDRDQKALAWAIRALVLYVPVAEKARPEPPKPPRKPARRLTPAQRKQYRGRPSWNGKPKRDWDGPELPERMPPPAPDPTHSDQR